MSWTESLCLDVHLVLESLRRVLGLYPVLVVWIRFQRSSATDVWFADIDQIWLEFVVAGSGGTSERSSRRRTVPLVDNFPLMAWVSRWTRIDENLASNTADNPSQTFCVVARLGTKDLKAQVEFFSITYFLSDIIVFFLIPKTQYTQYTQ